MALFSDNVPRADRVQQLAGDIARIQSKIKECVEDGQAQDQKSLKVLDSLAKKAGYKTLDEYEAAGMKLLTKEERAALEKMKQEILKFDSDMSISHTVFRGMIAAGVLLSGAKFTALGIEIETTQMLVFGLQSVLRGLYQALAGTVQAAVKLFTWGKVTLELVSNMPAILSDGEKALNIAKRGGNILLGIGVIVDAGLLIAEAILGSRQRADLQDAIKNLCYHRFISKQMELEAKVIADFKSDVHAFTLDTENHQKWIADGRETKGEAAEDVSKSLTLVKTLKTKLSKLSPQDTWDVLAKQDKDNGKSWTSEDASFSQIIAYIDDHPELGGKTS